MERIRLNLPPVFHFTTLLPIRITDVNYGGHVGNDTFLSILHEARVQYLNHFGYTELNVEGLGLIMADVAIEYKSEIHHPQILTIHVQAANFDRAGFDIYYLMEFERDGQKVIAAKAKTGMIAYDYSLKKKSSLPNAAMEKLAS